MTALLETSIDPRRAELDLLAVIESTWVKPAKLLKSGQPGLVFFREANARLHHPDDEKEHGFPQVEFWLDLATELKLLQPRDGFLVASDDCDTFFSLPVDRRIERMREAWLDSEIINEFMLCPDIEVTGSSGVSDEPDTERRVQARHTLVDALASLEGSVDVTDYLRALETNHRNLFIDHNDDENWRNLFYRGIREIGGRNDLERDGNWHLVEGKVLRFMLQLPLTAFAYIHVDGAKGTLEPAPEPRDGQFEVLVQPGFEVLTLGNPDAAGLWPIVRFTIPDGDANARKYLIDRARVTDALSEGGNTDDMLNTLQGLSRTPLPDNVSHTLKEWGTLANRVRIWPDALFIESEGADDLTKRFGDHPTLKVDFVAGGHAVTPAPTPAKLREVLPPRKQPLDYSRVLARVVEPADGASFTAPREKLDFRARRVLELIAERKGADRYVLSLEKVREASRNIDADELFRRIRDVLNRPLTDELELSLRTWSGEFDPPFVGEAEILIVEHPDQIPVLDRHPEVMAWRIRTLGKGAWLLKKGGTNALRKVLDQLRIPVRDQL